MRAELAVLLCAMIAWGDAHSRPTGTPPPVRLQVPSDWQSCFPPVSVTVQSSSPTFADASRRSPRSSTLNAGQRVDILRAVQVVAVPGVARVIRDFQNQLGLKAGDEIYVLADWELDYYHVWVNGSEVSGGLPVGDPKLFRILREPMLENWLMVGGGEGGSVQWTPDGSAFFDEKAIESCVEIRR